MTPHPCHRAPGLLRSTLGFFIQPMSGEFSCGTCGFNCFIANHLLVFLVARGIGADRLLGRRADRPLQHHASIRVGEPQSRTPSGTPVRLLLSNARRTPATFGIGALVAQPA